MPSIARCDIHVNFDHKMWLLMPEPEIIDAFIKALGTFANIEVADREKFPEFSVRLLILS